MLRISTCGGLTIQLDGKPASFFVSQKVRALLVYLVCNPHEHSREVLADLFWEDSDAQQAMGNLRVAVSNLKQHLAPYLTITRQSIAFDIGSSFWLDIIQMENATEAAEIQYKLHAALSEDMVAQLKATVQLYHGDFLAGFNTSGSSRFETWKLLQQEFLHNRILFALDKLAEYCIASEDYSAGIQVAKRLQQLEPLSETAVDHLMVLYSKTGQPTIAKAEYQAYKRLLADELGSAPSAATTQLFSEIAAGILPAQVEPKRLHLPTPATPFVDRPDETGIISEYLEDDECRLLTLVGLGGVGKSRLALHAAEGQIERMRDGVYFIPLSAPTSLELFLQAVTSSLNLTLQGVMPLEQELAEHLQNKHLLLVIDNAEFIADAKYVLSHLLDHIPDIRILATSRHALGLKSEWLFEVRGMNVPSASAVTDGAHYSAVKMFIQTARRVGANFSVSAQLAAIIRICQLVEGMPLAIELAASWARILPCTAIAHQIEQDAKFLASQFSDMPDRHMSLEGLFEQSLALLSDQERTALIQLSIFLGAFDSDGALYVANVSLPVLASLIQKSLINSDLSGRYTLHALIRRLAFDKLRSSELMDSCSERYCAFFAQRAEQWGQTMAYTLYGLTDFAPDYYDMQAAMGWALENNHREYTRKLSNVLITYWKASGYM